MRRWGNAVKASIALALLAALALPVAASSAVSPANGFTPLEVGRQSVTIPSAGPVQDSRSPDPPGTPLSSTPSRSPLAPPNAPTLLYPGDSARGGPGGLRPAFRFWTSDPEGNEVRYNIQVDDDPVFGTPAVDATSDATNSGPAVCSQPPTAAYFCMSGDWNDGDPFAQGSALNEVAFSPAQGALLDNTVYWWRVRASDPAGDNAFGAWSASRSYQVATAAADERWQQTSQAQFNLDTLVTAVTGATGGGRVELPATKYGNDASSGTVQWNAGYTDVTDILTVGATGTVTQWSFYKSSTTGSTTSKLKIFRDGGANLVFVGESTLQTATGGAAVYTYPTSVAVQAGDYIGLYTSSGFTRAVSCSCTTWDKAGDEVGTTAKSAWLAEVYRLAVAVWMTAPSGSVTSTPVSFVDGPAAKTSWGSATWSADVSAGSLTVAVQKFSGGSWVWTGLQSPTSPIALGSLAKESQIRLVGNLTSSSGSPLLMDWEVSWQSSATGPGASMVAPNGGETLNGGSGYSVQWTATQGTNPIHPNGISLLFSSAGAAGPWQMVKGNLANSGTYSWQVPQVNTTNGLLRVCAKDDQVNALVSCDDSNAPFSIQPGNAAPFLQLTWPRPGMTLSGTANFLWNASDLNSDRVDYQLFLSPDGGTTWQPAGTTSANETPSPTPRTHQVNTAQFPDGATYRWRVMGTDVNGASSNDSSPGNFVIDNGPPATSMGPLPPFSNSTTFTITYNGSDAGSGLAGIDIEVATDGGARAPLYSNATNNSASFTGQEGHFYEFYSLGWDRAGNREAKSAPDAKTTIDFSPPTSKVGMMPLYVPSLTFDVPFTVSDASGTDTTVHWRLTGGAWSPSTPVHLNQGQSAGKTAITVAAEGEYEFYSSARDDAGHQEAKAPAMEAKTIVDSKPPAVTITVADTLLTCSEKISVETDASDNLALARLVVEVKPSDGSAPWKVVLNRSASGTTFSGLLETQVPSAKDGKHLVRVTAVDGSGQTALSAETEFTFDCTKPSVSSSSPAAGATGVPVDGPFRVSFSEKMNESSVEKAIKIVGGGGGARIAGRNWSGAEVTLDIAGLEGNSSYTLSVTLDAADVAGNKLNASKEVKFSTVPTHGVLVGSIHEPGGAVVKNAVVRLTNGNENIVANVSKDGTFRVEPLKAGTWTVKAEAKGYNSVETSVEVVAAEERRADLLMEKDILPLLIGAAVAAAVLIALAIVAARLMVKKCPKCKNRLPKGANACPVCGHVVKQKSKLDLQREARQAKEADFLAQQRAVAAATPKKKKEKPKPGVRGVAVPLTAPPALATQKPRPTNCFACGAALKSEDEWCPKCGQSMGAADSVDSCKSCGGSVLDGVCINCGATLPEIDESGTPQGKPCPRCMSPLPEGLQFCDQCGHDLTTASSRSRMSEPEPARTPPEPDRTRPQTSIRSTVQEEASPVQTKATPAPDATTAPPVSAPLSPPASSMPGSLPPAAGGMLYCPTCGTSVPKDMVICDVCGEPMKR